MPHPSLTGWACRGGCCCLSCLRAARPFERFVLCVAQTSLVGPGAVEGKPMLEQAAGMLVMERCLCVPVLIDHARQFAGSEYSLLQSTPWEWQLQWGFDCHLKWKSAGSRNSGEGGGGGEKMLQWLSWLVQRRRSSGQKREPCDS